MATSRKNTNTPAPVTPTPDQMRAESLKRVKAVDSAQTAGKSAIEAATLESFNTSVTALVSLGEYAATVLAAILPAGKALTGDNVAALFGKDGALYPTDQDERDALKGKNIWARGIRAYQYDSEAVRSLFLTGPATLVPRCKDLASVTGHTPGVVAYHEFLGVMNADRIAATGKALESSFLASFNIYRDSETGETIYAKRKPASQQDSGKVAFKRDDLPALGKVIGLTDRAALVALVESSRYDLAITADDLPALAEYIAARYRLSLMPMPADAPVTPDAPAKVTTLS